jgi:Zn-dependent peptidase ImmA (M78 family)
MPRLSPEQSARELLRSLARRQGTSDLTAVRAGLHLPQLLEMLDLAYKEVPRITDSTRREFVGELDRANRVVLLSEAFPHLKAFTIAHEIGHHQLHQGPLNYRDLPGYVLGPQPQRPQEEDANLFATTLLMPAESVREAYFSSFAARLSLRALTDDHVYRLRLGHGLRPTRQDIEAMSVRDLARLAASASFFDCEPLHRAFGVSKEAMAIRLEQLDLVCLGRPARQDVCALAEVVVPVAPPPKKPSPSQPTPALSPARTVVLVGDYWHHPRNRIFLKRHGWDTVDDDSADAIAKLRTNPPCGVVVHSSFWKRLPSQRWEEAFKTLIELSSFIFVRVDLSDASELTATAVAKMPAALLDQRPVGAFRQTSDGRITDADLSALEQVFEVKQKATRVILHADGSEDAGLLKLIAAERFVATAGPQEVVVTAKRLAKGNSGARAYVLSANDGPPPVFVKVGEVRPLAAELEHTRQFQRHLPAVVVPQLRFHGAAAALVQQFISDDGTSTRPAPSLKKFLEDLSPDRAHLFVESVLPAVLELFKGLAMQRSNERSRHLAATLCSYRADVAEGRAWTQPPIAPQSIDDLGVCALQALTDYDLGAFVHGDAHLRNILLRNSTEPVLVDFANAGPGHPLFDFVRLELGIWTVLLKQVDRKVVEAFVQELLARARIGSEVEAAFKESGPTVAVVVQSSALIRESCRAVTRDDTAWFDQYRSMHALLALLAIGRPEDHYLSFAVFRALNPDWAQ